MGIDGLPQRHRLRPGTDPVLTSIIIPVYGDPALLTACMVAIVEADTPPHELVLVDNGTGVVLPEAADMVVINEQNQGFAKACNQGAEAASGDVLVFLNVDTEPQPGWLPPLVAPLTDPVVGATGARLIYPNGAVQHAGIELFRHKRDLAARNIKDDLPSRDVEGVTGACLAVRADVFAKVGGFDESYWNGYDDVDLCLKIRVVGFRIEYVAESTVVHHESATGPERWSKVNENVARLQKWKGNALVSHLEL
jgi:GT2 family glycosyltransferase